MSLGTDVRLLFLQRLFRMFGFGASTLILIPFLTELGISNKRIGIFMSCSLVGDGLLSTLTSMFTDRVGRRRVLVLGSLLMAASGIIFASCEKFWILLLASIIGVISPSGADVGPFMAIEETAMAQLVAPESLSTVLAWYYMLGSWGSAAGTLAAGWLVQSLTSKTWSTVDAYRANFLVYFLLGIVKVILSVSLGKRCELGPQEGEGQSHEGNIPSEAQPLLGDPGQIANEARSGISPATRSFAIKMCTILILDSTGAGIASNAWLTYFIRTKFDLHSGPLGSVFSACAFIESISNIAAIPLVRRIGLIPTMLIGHMVAASALFLLPFPPIVLGAIGLLFTRASFLDFDQAPRQTFISRSILPGERTLILGILNVVRTFGQSVGPIFAGYMSNRGMLGLALSTAGSIKLSCDVILFIWYLNI